MIEFIHLISGKNTCTILMMNSLYARTPILGIYSIGKEALLLSYGIYDMSLESITTKLMRCIGQGLSYEQVKTTMHTNIAGELDTSKAIFL